MLITRHDGTRSKDVPFTRRIMPLLMKGRTESTVYFEQQLDVTDALPFIDAYNAKHPEARITVFHLFVWAVVQTLDLKPRLNRFVSGGNLWDRKGISISFAAKKKKLDENAPLVTVKKQLTPGSLEAIAEQLHEEIAAGRSEKPRAVDKELNLAFALPSFVLRFVLGAMAWLDKWNLLPASVIDNDPLYTSMFVANLGSVGLDAAYHHLYEWGNCPFFAALGQTKDVVTPNGVRKIVTIRYAFDERIEDGLYCARAMELVKQRVENPAAYSFDQRGGATVTTLRTAMTEPKVSYGRPA